MANATITVSINGKERTIVLDGDELSSTTDQDGRVHKYLTNASRGFISDEIESALIDLTGDLAGD